MHVQDISEINLETVNRWHPAGISSWKSVRAGASLMVRVGETLPR